MKNYLFCFCVMLLSFTSYTQQIDWQNNYLDATAKAKSNEKNIIIFFVDGNDKDKELLIEQSIFNSELFKSEKDQFVFLKVNETKSDSLSRNQKRYNTRIIEAFNTRRKFPSFLVTDKNATEETKLFKRFSNKRIEKITEQLINLM